MEERLTRMQELLVKRKLWLAGIVATVMQVVKEMEKLSLNSDAYRYDKTMDMFQRMRPPHFLGSTVPVEAENWLGQMETIFIGMSCPEPRKVALAVLELEGSATHWWQSQLQIKFTGRTNDEISWEEFCEAF